jgi:hypothetical protein
VLASAETADAINPMEIPVIDGDTIKGQRTHDPAPVEFDAPESGSQASRRERELGNRATAQLKVPIAGQACALRPACHCPAEYAPAIALFIIFLRK